VTALLSGALHVFERNALVYRRIWRGSIFSSFVQPTLFLLAIGVGLGALVDSGGASLPGDVPFLHFLAPGLLAAACMQTASFESSFPVIHKLTAARNYEAITTTPIGVPALVVGELAWIGVRLLTVATTFMLVLVAFEVPRTPLAVLAVPAAILTGLAFSAAVLAYAATLQTPNGFNAMFRFGLTPLFLFSGVFFPITRLPEPLQLVAWATPLFHGVELVRGLTLGTLDGPAWVAHVLYLGGMVLLAARVAVATFSRRLGA
jgi:lipooligosaccharide transport system permease protein